MISGKQTFSDTDRLYADYLGKFNDAGILPETQAEIAFIGRSNSGKSSLLKVLLNSPKMPQVSSRPGSTRLIHLYKIGGSNATLADFPGYGYAKSARTFRERFSTMLTGYLASKRATKALCLVMDVRREAEAEEEEIARIARERRVPLLLCLNKADTLNQSETTKVIKRYTDEKGFFEILLVSAQKRRNLDYLKNFISSLG